MRRKIMVVTGKRGGYGAMKPMLQLLRDDNDFELQLVVTDQHLNKSFGATIKEVESDFEIASAVDMEQKDGTALSRAQALGLCSTKMAEVIHRLEPDFCLLYGDRGEVMATAMAATTMGVAIGHMQGGDLSGSTDEQVRHAVTKLAHLHFPSTAQSARRIIGMGEEEWRITVTGDHHLDLIQSKEFAGASAVAEVTGINFNHPVLVVLQHSETTAPEKSYQQMCETLISVRDSGVQSVIVYPCSDVGYEGVIQAINEFKDTPQFKIFKNLDAHIFWGLLAVSSVLIGNSSAGIIESPCFRLPTVNIGRRQEGRMQSENVINVDHCRFAIASAIDKALNDPSFKVVANSCGQIYGDGNAGIRTVDVLRSIPLDDRLLIKRMAY